MSGNERRLGLGGTQLMEQAPLGTPEAAPPRAPGTQLIAQTPEPQAPAQPPEAQPQAPQPPQPPWGPPQAPQNFANAVPAYGIPPDAFPQGFPPQQPVLQAPPPQSPPMGYGNALPQYGAPQAYGGFSVPKTDHIGPRLKGGAVLLFGLALLGFNAFLIFTQGSFYPKTLILAFPLSWVGLFMVVAGKPVNPTTHHPPAWWMVLCYGGALFAFIVGIIAAIMITD